MSCNKRLRLCKELQTTKLKPVKNASKPVKTDSKSVKNDSKPVKNSQKTIKFKIPFNWTQKLCRIRRINESEFQTNVKIIIKNKNNDFDDQSPNNDFVSIYKCNDLFFYV